MMDSVIGFIQKIISFLPADPFSEFIDSAQAALADSGFMGSLNYFVPVNVFVAISKRWILAVGAFIIIRAVVKFLKGEQ